jgi:hypothetical protein
VLEFQNAAHLVVRGFGFAPTQPAVDAVRIRQATDLAFEANTFTGIGGTSIAATSGDTQRITVRQNSFLTVESTALSFGCEDGTSCRARELLIEDNIIDRVTSSGVGHGIEIRLNSAATNRSNLISGTLSAGIFVQGATVSDAGAIVEQNYVESAQTTAGIVIGGGPALVSNNILVGNAFGGISAQNYAGRNLQQNIWIVHNTILDNANSGINVAAWSAGSGNVIAFNAIGPRTGTASLSPSVPAAAVTGNVTCNPPTACFVEAVTPPYDLTPLPGGPLFETAGGGTEPWRPTVDFFGTPRVGSADVGAVEGP